MKEVVIAAKRGDTAARDRLIASLRPRVERTATYYAGLTRMDRDDLQQEMWLGLLEALRDVDVSIGDPVCFLVLRGKWRLLEAVRRSHRERSESIDAVGMVADDRSFEDEVMSRWETGQLFNRLADSQQRICAGLLQGYRQEEIARTLGCTASNISYHVRKIREGFRALAVELPS